VELAGLRGRPGRGLVQEAPRSELLTVEQDPSVDALDAPRARNAYSARRSGRRRWRVVLSRCSHAVCKAASRRRMRSSHPSRCFCRTPVTASSPTARTSSSRTAGALTPPLHTASTEPSSATSRTSPPSSSSSVEEPAARSGAWHPPPPAMARSATGTGELAYRTAVSRTPARRCLPQGELHDAQGARRGCVGQAARRLERRRCLRVAMFRVERFGLSTLDNAH